MGETRTKSGANVLRWMIALCAVLLMTLSAGADYPKPSPITKYWQLDFQSGAMRLWTDRSTGQNYWYFTYTVENNTGRDRFWAPEFTLFTDDGHIRKSGADVERAVVEQILDFLGNDLLESQTNVLGDILQGEENAKEGLVVWPASDLTVTELSLFIAGTSGETVRMRNPMTGKEFIMRKTIQRDYRLPGDATNRGSTPLDLVNERWILR